MAKYRAQELVVRLFMFGRIPKPLFKVLHGRFGVGAVVNLEAECR